MDDQPQHRSDEPAMPDLSVATLLAVFGGGALGTLARYLLEAHLPLGPGGFPWVTLLINLSGSLAIGLCLTLSERLPRRVQALRPLVVVGFLGGWTTYSTLAVDAVTLTRHGDALTAVAYLAATVVGGLALVVVGQAAAKRVAQR